MIEGYDLPCCVAGSSDCYYMPVATKPSMVTIGSHGARPRQSRWGRCETQNCATLMGEWDGWPVGFHVGREQWTPAAIPTILAER